MSEGSAGCRPYSVAIVHVTMSERRRARRSARGHWRPSDGRCDLVEVSCPSCSAIMVRGLLPCACPRCGIPLAFHCPWVGCRHHLYLDVSPRTGSIKLNWPGLEPDELAESCAIDIAAEGMASLERVGAALNISREGARAIVVRAAARVVSGLSRAGLDRAAVVAALREIDSARARSDASRPEAQEFDVSGLEGDVDAAARRFRKSRGIQDESPIPHGWTKFVSRFGPDPDADADQVDEQELVRELGLRVVEP